MTSLERRLARRFDSRPWRAAEAGYQLALHTRRWWRDAGLRQRPLTHNADIDALQRQVAGLPPGDISERAGWVCRALDIALAGGAYSIALRLAERALLGLDQMSREQRLSVLPAAVELFVALGDSERTENLLETHRPELSATARGAGLLCLLHGDAGIAAAALPDGKPNVFRLSRLVRKKELSGPGLLELMAEHPRWLLRRPDLHLLVHAAYRVADPAYATAAMNRYFRSQRLPECTDSGSSGHLLCDIAFSGRRKTVTGPLVSVIVSAHNAASTIDYAINSLLHQTYQDIEILVCDDCSDDDTRGKLQRYANDPRVRLFASVGNQGTYNIRNHMIERARGAYITFQDSDDLSLPTRIATQVRRLSSGGGVACVSSWIRVGTDGTVVFFKDHAASRLGIVSLMATKSVFRQLGPYRTARFGADLEYYEGIRAHYGPARTARLRSPLLLGLWSSSSITRRGGAESLETGYRSPARRVYSELAFRQRVLGTDVVSDVEIVDVLRETANYAEPTGVRGYPW